MYCKRLEQMLDDGYGWTEARYHARSDEDGVLLIEAREERLWYNKLGQPTEAEDIDVRKLLVQRKGQGRVSKWTDGEVAALVKYLQYRPKAGSGVCKWPSVTHLAKDKGTQRKWGIPAATAWCYCDIAKRRGKLQFKVRYVRPFLTKQMMKRREALAAKYGHKNAAWWKGVAFQDEGHIAAWQMGPGKVWQSEEQLHARRPLQLNKEEKRRETRAKVKGTKGKVSFSVLFAFCVKAELYCYTDTLHSARAIDMIDKQVSASIKF
jgi:hypothetical protein